MERSKVNELNEQNALLCQNLEETRTSAAADHSRLEELQGTVTELEKLQSSRIAEIDQLKTLSQEQSENLDKEKQNVAQREEVNRNLSTRLSTMEAELEKSRTETEEVKKELQRSKAGEESISLELNMEKCKVSELEEEVARLSVHADTSDIVAKVVFILYFQLNSPG